MRMRCPVNLINAALLGYQELRLRSQDADPLSAGGKGGIQEVFPLRSTCNLPASKNAMLMQCMAMLEKVKIVYSGV